MVTITSTISTLTILLSLCFSRTKAITNKINKGQSINVSETLVSPNGKFELRFFQPQDSQHYYVGIWYKNINDEISEYNCVWVANRDYPVLSSSILTINSDGNIVISDGRMLYMVTNITSTTSKVNEERQAMVLDSGNFVLRDNESLQDQYLWQSFDYPTHAIWPGMKFSKVSFLLVSWKSEDNPFPGRFSMKFYSDSKRFIITEGNKNYRVLLENNVLNEDNFFFGDESSLSEGIHRVLTDSGELKLEKWSASEKFWCSESKCLEKKYKKGHEKFFRNVYVISFTTLILAILLVVAFVYIRTKQLREKGENLLLFDVEMSLKHCTEELPELNHKRKKGRKKSFKLSFFSYTSVRNATANFSNENKVGEGGFGPVYKGTLFRGDEVAVKRLSTKSRQGKEQFKNEAHLIARVQHKNLVRLLGCCIERKEQILIYEYMPNKSLDFFLYDSTRRKHLKWPIRVKIIEGIVQGLIYLHNYSRIKIVHRDLKPSNILLDIDMNPKISDFGLARIFAATQLQGNMGRPVGTVGYMSPESSQQGLFSEKSDIYSFGVLFLEIVSGKRNTDIHNAETRGLVAYAWELWTTDRAMELLDPLLSEDPTAILSALRYVHIALLCVQELAVDRPNMSQVLLMLSHSSEKLPYPNQPGFLNSTSFARPRADDDQAEAIPQVPSVNEASLSVLEPR